MAGDHLATRLIGVLILTNIVFQYLSGLNLEYYGASMCDRPDFYQFNNTCCAQFRNCTLGPSFGAALTPPDSCLVNIAHESNDTFVQLAGTASSYGCQLGYNIIGFFQFMPIFIPILWANSYAHKLWVLIFGLVWSLWVVAFFMTRYGGEMADYSLMIQTLPDNAPINSTITFSLTVDALQTITLCLIPVAIVIMLILRLRNNPYMLYIDKHLRMTTHVSMLLDPQYRREQKLAAKEKLQKEASEKRMMREMGHWELFRYKCGHPCHSKENPHAPFEKSETCAFFFPQRLFMACAFSTVLLLRIAAFIVSSVDYHLVELENYVAGFLSVLGILGLPQVTATLVQLDNAIRACMYLSLALMFVIYIILWVIIFRGYRTRIMELRQGIYRFSKTDFSLWRCVEYIAIQGFSFVAFFAIFTVIFLAFCLLCAMLYYSQTFGEFLGSKILHILVDLAIFALTVRIMEIVYLRYICASAGGHHFRHRRLLAIGEWVSLYAFIFLALFQVFLRLIVSIGSQIATFPLLFLSSCPRSFEGLDPGHRSFNSMLLMDHLCNNPVLNVFADMCMKRTKQERKATEHQWMQDHLPADAVDTLRAKDSLLPSLTVSTSVSDGMTTSLLSEHTDESPVTSRQSTASAEPLTYRGRGVRRWFLAYTLLNNPQLRKLRWHAKFGALHFERMKSNILRELEENRGKILSQSPGPLAVGDSYVEHTD